MRISCLILTKNEEKNISRCLNSVAFCDEILIIDDNSTDKTSKIAEQHKARVLKRDLRNNWAGQRNWGLSKARGPWVLFLDADEVIPVKLREEIIKATADSPNRFSAFYFKRQDNLWGKNLKHGESGRIKLIRLALKKAGKWTRCVHETWQTKGAIGQFNNPILHHPHPTLKDFITSINYQSDLHAKANKKEGKRATLRKIIFYPCLKFFDNWIFKQGFLDGLPGFLVALVMSFHSFLSWAKLWMIQKNYK